MTDPAGGAGDLGELGRLAEALGVQTSYWDTRGRLQHATPAALVAVLVSMGAPVDRPDRLDDLRHHVAQRSVRFVEPVVVAPAGAHEVALDVCMAVTDVDGPPLGWELIAEGGGTTRGQVAVATAPETDRREVDGVAWSVRRIVLALPEGVAVGYHRLVLMARHGRHEATVVVTPGRVATPGPTERSWGVLAPLYAVRPAGLLGPHVGDLDEIARWIGAHGGQVIATLPVLATYLDRPFDPSPYTPVSQRFWNELYLDVEAAPEFAASVAARGLLAEPSVQRALMAQRDAPLFDHRARYALVRPVLDEMARTFFAAPSSTRAAFDRWLDVNPAARAYAAFRAATDHTGTGWHAWGVGAGHLPAVVDPDGDGARLHQYVQWTMHRQLTEVAAGLAERGQRLYLDLPVGTHGDGFDTWADHDHFAWGCGVGAPPDDFFGDGQNWGFPPVDPAVARAEGHRHFAACLRHHMGVAGLLRLDHVMGLHRLFWVPDGADARDGVYVRYPREELFAVLAVESSRQGCRVVGEDLGTVPDEVRDAMDRHGLLSMYVSQFRLPGDDGRIPLPAADQLASIDTHDTPTFAGWLAGGDVAQRRAMDLVDDDTAAEQYAERQRDVDRLVAALALDGLLPGPGGVADTLVALLRELGGSPAAAVLVGVDDLLGETDPQNVPGTGLDRPNWVRKLDRPIAQIDADPRVRSTLAALQGARLAAYETARKDHA